MKKNHHLHRLVRLCLIISLLLLCSTSQVFAAAKVNLKNTKIKLSATKLTYNQKVQRPKVSVTYKGKVLKEKKNYVLKYSKGCKKVDFGAKSALELIEKYDNLLVVQTFSKSRSMAGMRIGFACGHPQLISFLNDVKYTFISYTMDRTTLATGVAAIQDKAYFTETCEKIIATREWAKKELAALGFTFPDSKTNFIFASHKSCPAKEIFEALRQEHIYVRYFPKPRIDNHLRITVGTQEEMEKLIHFLEKYLKNHK